MTWKKRVSKSNVLLFQLQASVLGTKEKESGSLDTMYPTPSASCQMDVVAPPDTVSQNSKGWSVTRLKTGTKFGAKLNDVINKLDHEGMYPTPMARDYKDMGFKPTWKWRRDKSVPSVALKDNTHGGKLNPNFVEFLMGYPTNWTKIEPIE
tara:strand:- start:134 stop:586 length:453 start_codon:yes stop_codon:yes gene_type:complete